MSAAVAASALPRAGELASHSFDERFGSCGAGSALAPGDCDLADGFVLPDTEEAAGAATALCFRGGRGSHFGDEGDAETGGDKLDDGGELGGGADDAGGDSAG